MFNHIVKARKISNIKEISIRLPINLKRLIELVNSIMSSYFFYLRNRESTVVRICPPNAVDKVLFLSIASLLGSEFFFKVLVLPLRVLLQVPFFGLLPQKLTPQIFNLN